MAKNRRYLLSGTADAHISLWDMDTGVLMDSAPLRGAQRVTALAFTGPLMVRCAVPRGITLPAHMPFRSTAAA